MSQDDFLDGEQGIVHDGLPDLSKYVFIHSSLDDAGLDPYEFRVFCHLRRRAKDRMAWPGMRSISEVTGISLNKVCLSIRTLQHKGYLQVHKRPNNQSNLYLVCSPQEHSVPDKNSGVLIENAGVPDKNERVSIEGYPIKGIQRGISTKGKPAKEEVTFFVTSLGLTEQDANALWDSWLVNGFRTKSGPVKDWQACARNWKRYRWFPSQKYNGFSGSQPKADPLGRTDARRLKL